MAIPEPLTDGELAVLITAADVLIPAYGPWPAPSTTRLARYIADAATRALDIASLRRSATTLSDLSTRPDADRVQALIDLEAAESSDFLDLREFITYGYYAQNEVVRVLQSELDCDYHSPPQPVGYVMELDEDITPPSIGSYTPTASITRVDLSVLPPSHDLPWPLEVGAAADTQESR